MAFHPIDRDTDYLLPSSVQEWLPDAHLARYVVDVVEGLDLSDLERAYAGRGSDAYHPATLLSLLIYGYATGTFSSRKIERATYDSLTSLAIAIQTTTPWPPSGNDSARSSATPLSKCCKWPGRTDSRRLARSVWTARRFTPMPAGIARCRTDTSRRSKPNSRRKSRRCWNWRKRQIRPPYLMA